MSLPPVTTDIPAPKRPQNIFQVPLIIILVVGLFMAGWYAAAQLSDQTVPQSQGAAALDSGTLAERIEADDVEIVYTDDPELNCAATEGEDGTVGQGGCVYMGTTPERMFVSKDMSEADLTYVLVHEYAHILQARGAWPVGGASATGMGGLDSECWADAYAASQGVPYEQLHYIKTCVFPGGLSLPTAP